MKLTQQGKTGVSRRMALWRKLLGFNGPLEGRIASSSFVQPFNLKKI
jgi:hypothetical protein